MSAKFKILFAVIAVLGVFLTVQLNNTMAGVVPTGECDPEWGCPGGTTGRFSLDDMGEFVDDDWYWHDDFKAAYDHQLINANLTWEISFAPDIQDGVTYIPKFWGAGCVGQDCTGGQCIGVSVECPVVYDHDIQYNLLMACDVCGTGGSDTIQFEAIVDNVVVQPVDDTTDTTPVSLTFDNVTQAGTTTLVTSETGPSSPSGFQLGTPPTYYDLDTTADFSGSIEVCIDYTGISFAAEEDLRLYHYESNEWVDVTNENYPNTEDDIICGTVNSLSPFGIFERAMAIEVEIDIKPGSYPNSINLKSKGKVPVAILTTDDFDAYNVDPDTTVTFAGANPLRWTMEDVDADGDSDLLFHFKTKELDLTNESTDATLEGETYNGITIRGTDSVNMVPKGKAHSKQIKKQGKKGKKGKKSK